MAAFPFALDRWLTGTQVALRSPTIAKMHDDSPDSKLLMHMPGKILARVIEYLSMQGESLFEDEWAERNQRCMPQLKEAAVMLEMSDMEAVCTIFLNKQVDQSDAPTEGALDFEQRNCVLCLERPKTHTFSPCGHCCLCGQCAESFRQSAGQIWRCVLCGEKASSLTCIRA